MMERTLKPHASIISVPHVFIYSNVSQKWLRTEQALVLFSVIFINLNNCISAYFLLECAVLHLLLFMKFKQLIWRGNLLICISVPKETSCDLKHLLMGLLQRNHRERISFGKPLSFLSHRIYERICFWVCLLNLLFLFLHSQKSFFTIRSWRQVHPQRNVGMRRCCVQSGEIQQECCCRC